MLLDRNPKGRILGILLMSLTSGCDERATQIALDAADRQAQQNTAMAELNTEVAGGARHLVEADAKARSEMVTVHRELQAERTRLDSGWTALNQERREVASQRRTESMLVPAISLIGSMLLVIVLLGFCWYALVVSRRSDDADAELSELLTREFLADQLPLLSASQLPPTLLGQSRPVDQVRAGGPAVPPPRLGCRGSICYCGGTELANEVLLALRNTSAGAHRDAKDRVWAEWLNGLSRHSSRRSGHEGYCSVNFPIEPRKETRSVKVLYLIIILAISPDRTHI